MSLDRRELILNRLRVLLGEIDGVVSSWRNRGELPAKEHTPAVIVLDGGEKISTNIKGQNFNEMVSAYFTLTPEVFLVLTQRDTVENNTVNFESNPVGEELSAYRTKIIAAVVSDETLTAMVGDGGQIEYRGSETDMRTGSTIGAFGAQMQLFFAITYPLRIQDL